MGARTLLNDLLASEEQKCLAKIGILQELRKQIDGMYLCDLEAVLLLHYKLRSFD